MAKPAIPNIDLLIQMGFPRDVVEYYTSKKGRAASYPSILQAMRVLDEQNHLSRFSWYVLSYYGLDPDLMERILYYRGTAILWYDRYSDIFRFTPYVGEGLDLYGRYQYCTPLPFVGSTGEDPDSHKPYIPDLKLKPVYDYNLEDLTGNNLSDVCVVFYDYSKQLAQKIIPRQILNDPICQAIAECIPFARTALINNTGVMGYRVQDQTEAGAVDDANRQVLNAALCGQRWIPIKNSIPAEEMRGGSSTAIQDNLLVMEAFDNFRLSTHGIDNGGLFRKKAHMLQSEQAMNNQDSSSVIHNCLWNRRNACSIAMSIWNLPIWVDISQGQSGFDRDADGQLDTDQIGPDEFENIEEGGMEE